MARTIALSLGYKAEVSDKDYVRAMSAGPWHAHVDRKKKAVYAHRNFQKQNGSYTMQKLHRFILGLSDPRILVDHRDGNGLNNCRKNLRIATPSQSSCNRGKPSNNTSGFVGVSWHKKAKKFEAHVKVLGKKTHLGLFLSLEDAAKAANTARRKAHKTFASMRA
jgi:AP2 domain